MVTLLRSDESRVLVPETRFPVIRREAKGRRDVECLRRFSTNLLINVTKWSSLPKNKLQPSFGNEVLDSNPKGGEKE